MKKLVAKKDVECMACLQCVAACSEAFYKEFDEDKSCVRIVAKGTGAKPNTCIQCGKCMRTCEHEAITQNPKTGVYMINKKKCVSCGKCAEVCPAGAAKLGQKLCDKHGNTVEYPKHELPHGLKWGEEHWDPDYRDNNRKNCYDKGTAPCKTACPAHVAVQGYLKLAAQGKYQEALALIKKDNPFPAVCGRICNKRCEEACTRGDVDRAVAIDEIKKFINDTYDGAVIPFED